MTEGFIRNEKGACKRCADDLFDDGIRGENEMIEERKRYLGDSFCLIYRLYRGFVCDGETGNERIGYSMSASLIGAEGIESEKLEDFYSDENEAGDLFDAMADGCVMPYVLHEIFEEYDAAR